MQQNYYTSCIFLLMGVLSFVSFVTAAPTFKKERVKLPNFVKVCHRNDPELNSCARKSLENLKNHLKVGIPELFVPPIDPLVIPEIKMDQDSGAIYLHSTYKNINIRGLSNFTLDDLTVDTSKLKFSMTMSFPNVSMNALYVMKGKIMMMPLIGEGEFKANFTDVNLHTVISVQEYKKLGKNHIRLRDIKVSYTLGKAELHLGNLFNGDKALGERMNIFLNENWDSLSEEIRPLMENAMAGIIRSSTVKLFDLYSYDDLLPE